MGLFGEPNVEKMKARKNVRGLIKALEYQTNQKTKNRKQAAAIALLKLKILSPRAIKPYIARLLSKVKSGGNWERVREDAVKALGEIGDPRAVEPLIAELEAGYGYKVVQQAAAIALGKIGDPRAVEPLIAELKAGYTEMRKAAAEALGKIGDPRAVEPLIAALKNRDEKVRKAAAEALDKLGWLPDEGAIGAAYWIAKEKWYLCVKIGDPAVEPLTAALKDVKCDVRRFVARALGKIGDPRAVEPLTAAFKAGDKEVRKAAANALGEIGDPRALEALIAALKARDEEVRKTAAAALDKTGWLPDEGADGAAYWVAKNEWARCVKIGAPAVEPLVAALKDESWKMRWAAAAVLGKIGDPRAVEPLIATLNDEEWGVRTAAAFALGEIGDPCVVETLITVLKDDDENVRLAAVEALSKFGDPRALEPLISLLGALNWHVRRTAADALVQLYRSGRLDNYQQKRLLIKRSAITCAHVDKNIHTDRQEQAYFHTWFSDCKHGDSSEHQDKGIGVSFPV